MTTILYDAFRFIKQKLTFEKVIRRDMVGYDEDLSEERMSNIGRNGNTGEHY